MNIDRPLFKAKIYTSKTGGLFCSCHAYPARHDTSAVAVAPMINGRETKVVIPPPYQKMIKK
ncbi:MAG: hypothetical protein A3C79_03295 [Candidatus Taylorbacteria bacterium RIFCSPHIGHO2_02_FULL_45_28]|nr:MAG: hypothetical protein A3C79_03295 [Candidatus Taylorbacteria bacterium RIFCSPHIGHO2_02_FULL_45_28]